MEGFTNLDKHTPKNQQGQNGNHALVIMFQPFKGQWVQSLVLAERAGLKVDGIANDGASWNRAMWDHFGVTEKNVRVEYCRFDMTLVVFLRFSTLDQVLTRQMVISITQALVCSIRSRDDMLNLKVNCHLREEHIKPQYYQKMNVALAFQFFGAAAKDL
ncbi:hypothetical protein TSAR_013394 [Trichomalopsis sarcophagae]|uniref:Uncharacterized protein n=1 Tax=Trichomalopsis sarcophagae TaxID=543379 RepID=A0A232ED64_9HYME|nr:hypothetical protein TSAR_013394 [Trichomalopsis sarcophagae]